MGHKIKIIETTETKIIDINMKDLGTGMETDIVMVTAKKDKGIM